MFPVRSDGSFCSSLSKSRSGWSRSVVVVSVVVGKRLDRAERAGSVSSVTEVPGEENKECAVTTKKFVETVSVARAGDIEALLDTGACISMVRRASLPEALLARMEAWKRAPLCGAGNKAIYPLGTEALTIRREGKAVDLPELAVVDACPYPMLLGNDYLEIFGGFINCRTGELVAEIPKVEVTGGDAVGMAVDGDEVETIAGEREEMHAVGGNVCCATDGRDGHLHCTEQKWRVWPVETCVVPARSTVFVDMELGIKEGKEVIIESKFLFHSSNEWVVPRAVVQVEKHCACASHELQQAGSEAQADRHEA